ncbi:MAG: LrgB family protein [Pseudomonadota bacterium]
MSSHVFGNARALQLNERIGAFSSLGTSLNALTTAALTTTLIQFIA